MQYNRTLMLGDSIFFGARVNHGQTVPHFLELALAHHPVPTVCVREAVNGHRSWEIVDRAWQHLGHDDWIRYCVCLMGTNDSKPAARTPAGAYLEQWERLLRYCTLTDTHLVAVEIPWIDASCQPEYDERSVDHICTLNTALAAWAPERGVPLADGLFERFFSRPELLTDGIHPTAEGNLIIANRIYEITSRPRNSVGVPDSIEHRLFDRPADCDGVPVRK